MSNLNDDGYLQYLMALTKRYRSNTAGRPVFVTDFNKGKAWKRYMEAHGNQKYHDCCACRSFINHFGGLVTINAAGRQKSALWHIEDATYQQGVIATAGLMELAETAKVTGVFYSDQHLLGAPIAGGWRHMHLENDAQWKSTVPEIKTPQQDMAKKREEYSGLMRAMREFTPAMLKTAEDALDSGQLYRAERVRPQLKWFAETRAECASGPKPDANLVWLAVATAPAGFAHVRSSMLGSLLQDIAGGFAFDSIKARFNTKMQPGQYQSAQTAPKVGQIEAAEKAVEALGIAPAFARRYTDLLDLADAFLWEPSEVYSDTTPMGNTSASVSTNPKIAKPGVFDALKPDPVASGVPFAVAVPPRKMTWERFAQLTLPGAATIEFQVPLIGRFCGLTAAKDNSAPPILQWDMPGSRNTVSWCFPEPPARAEEWNLQPGTLVPVTGIIRSPNLWGEQAQEHHGQGVFLLLQGAKDTRNLPGGGLFVEHLRSELKPYRATIEAHLNKLTVAGADDPYTAAFGIGLLAGNDWTQVAAPTPVAQQPGMAAAAGPKRVHIMLVVDNSGSMRSYIDAARLALCSLLESMQAMPGEVDVSVYMFGSHIQQLCSGVSLSAIGNIEQQLNGSSGQTALNDAIGKAISQAPVNRGDDSYFLGIVTDGEENNSREYSTFSLAKIIREMVGTKLWTIAYAGAGHNPREYADKIGIPPGNVAVFSASSEGFRDIGQRYAAGTRSLSAAYRSGAKASTSFFASATGTRAIGHDYPVLIVTTKSGKKSAYMLDRFE